MNLRLSIVVLLVFITTAAAQKNSKSVKDLFVDETSPSSNVQAPSAPRPSADQEIATVNGRPINRDDFLKVLYASAGNRILRQMIGLELAKQMAAAEGVEPAKDDFDREYRSVVNQLGPEKDQTGKLLSYDDHRRILRAILIGRGLSFEEFEIGIRHQVYLKAIVRKQIKITDTMVREEFARVYGPKRKIRVITVADQRVAEEVFNRLQKGEDFAVLASKYSIDFASAPIGGQFGDITRNDPRVPPTVCKTAFELAVGKSSTPIKVNEKLWIIKVDQHLPPQPISFDKVKNQLQSELFQRMESQMIEKLELELFKSAKIKVYDKGLSGEFTDWLKQMKDNESQ